MLALCWIRKNIASIEWKRKLFWIFFFKFKHITNMLEGTIQSSTTRLVEHDFILTQSLTGSHLFSVHSLIVCRLKLLILWQNFLSVPEEKCPNQLIISIHIEFHRKKFDAIESHFLIWRRNVMSLLNYGVPTSKTASTAVHSVNSPKFFWLINFFVSWMTVNWNRFKVQRHGHFSNWLKISLVTVSIRHGSIRAMHRMKTIMMFLLNVMNPNWMLWNMKL